jgi:hypothetical protein
MVRATGVARNPSADTDLLLRLVHSEVHTLYFAVIYRLDLPEPVYDAVVAHPDSRVRGILADCWNAPASQRARLAADADDVVRRSVAMGPQPFRMAVEPLPDETYAQLAGGP